MSKGNDSIPTQNVYTNAHNSICSKEPKSTDCLPTEGSGKPQTNPTKQSSVEMNKSWQTRQCISSAVEKEYALALTWMNPADVLTGHRQTRGAYSMAARAGKARADRRQGMCGRDKE